MSRFHYGEKAVPCLQKWVLLLHVQSELRVLLCGEGFRPSLRVDTAILQYLPEPFSGNAQRERGSKGIEERLSSFGEGRSHNVAERPLRAFRTETGLSRDESKDCRVDLGDRGEAVS